MNLFATIIEGEVDFADVCLLIAVVLFVIAAVIPITQRAPLGAILPAGLAFVALALLVL